MAGPPDPGASLAATAQTATAPAPGRLDQPRRPSPVTDAGPFVRRLFALAEEEGARLVVLRHHHGLPDVLTKRDLSLLVDRADAGAFVRAVRRVAEEQGYVVVRNPRRLNALALTVLRHEPAPDGTCRARTLTLDARLDDAYPLPAAPAPWSRRPVRLVADRLRTRPVTREGCRFHVPDPRDEFLVLMKHWRRKGDPTTRDELEDLLRSSALESWVREVGGRPRGPVLGERYENADDALVARLVDDRWGPFTPTRRAADLLRAARNRLVGRRPRLAPIVYLGGPDGCGKSTIADAVARALGAQRIPCTPLYSLKKYLRWVTHRLAWLKHRVGGRREPAARADAGDAPEFSDDFRTFRMEHDHADRDTGRRAWRVRKWFALVVGVADIVLGWTLALGYRLRGRVVVVETSPYEVFVKYHMPEFPRTEAVLARLIPKPTCGLLVRVDPERLVARKAELSADEVRDYYARLERVHARGRVAERFTDLDNDGTPGEALAAAMPLVLAPLAPEPPR